VVHWKSPPREDAETTWQYAARRHGWHALLGLAWLSLVYALDPSFLRWLLPVAGALLVAIPVSVLTSRVSAGRAARQAGLFVIPEEAEAPAELAEVSASLRRLRRTAVRPKTGTAPIFLRRYAKQR
jgi:membrane glycosyltransferase